MTCIFCKIVSGQITCHRVHEDKHTLSFLDVGPLARGHTLVIPKSHYATLDQMPAELAGKCMQIVARIAPAILIATGAKAWNVLQNNGREAQQSVDHVHFHIIPRQTGDSIGYRWNASKLDESNARSLRDAIENALNADAFG